MYKGAVFFDYDGTMVDEQDDIHTPSKMSIHAIEQLQKNGYLCVLATGRPLSCVHEDLRIFDGYTVTNGAFTIVEDEVISSLQFSDTQLNELEQYFKENDICYIFEEQDSTYVSDIENPNYKRMMEQFQLNEAVYFPLDRMEKGAGIYKVSAIVKKADDLEKVQRDLEGQYETAPFMLGLYCDLTLKNVTKATGVRNLTQYFGIDRSNTYAFGDGMNDFEMLKEVGHGIAMGRHMKGLEKAADYITRTVKEEGITHALNKYGLL